MRHGWTRLGVAARSSHLINNITATFGKYTVQSHTSVPETLATFGPVKTWLLP